MSPTIYILQALSLIVQFLIIVIFVRAIISWFPINRDNPFIEILDRLSEPVLAPLRRVVPLIGMFDITPLVALILLQVISGVLRNMIASSLY